MYFFERIKSKLDLIWIIKLSHFDANFIRQFFSKPQDKNQIKWRYTNMDGTLMWDVNERKFTVLQKEKGEKN